MARIGVLVVASLLAFSQSVAAVSFPVLTIELYAPAQEDSPVRIVGFSHNSRDIEFALSNSTNKTVASIAIGHIGIVPRGCAAETRQELSSMHNGLGFQVKIDPLGTAVAYRQDSDYPRWLVRIAQDLGATRLVGEVKVISVHFSDGSSWPARTPLRMDLTDQDRRLVDAVAGNCPDDAVVRKALEFVKQVVFDGGGLAPNSIGNEGGHPHLKFSCSLSGPRATCYLGAPSL